MNAAEIYVDVRLNYFLALPFDYSLALPLNYIYLTAKLYGCACCECFHIPFRACPVLWTALAMILISVGGVERF